LTQLRLAFSIDKNSGGLEMTEITLRPTFGNIADWLDGYENETSPQMRRGMLEALFYKKNFHDSTGLSHGKQVLYLIQALSTSKNTHMTICYGFEMAMQKVLWRRAGVKWPKGVNKESIFRLLKFLEDCHNRKVDPVHFRRDLLENFLDSVVTFYPPDKNKAAENSLIIRTVIACGEISLLEHGQWRGDRQVIKEIMKKFDKNSNPFRDGWRHVYSDTLAIHLARAGEMDEVIKKYLK
jgi:hypothetical protein